MKKTVIALIAILVVVAGAGAGAWAGLQDRSSSIELAPNPQNYIRMPELATAPDTPVSGWGKVYTTGNNIYFKDDAGEFAGNAGADTTLTVHIAYRIHTAGL